MYKMLMCNIFPAAYASFKFVLFIGYINKHYRYELSQLLYNRLLLYIYEMQRLCYLWALCSSIRCAVFTVIHQRHELYKTLKTVLYNYITQESSFFTKTVLVVILVIVFFGILNIAVDLYCIIPYAWSNYVGPEQFNLPSTILEKFHRCVVTLITTYLEYFGKASQSQLSNSWKADAYLLKLLIYRNIKLLIIPVFFAYYLWLVSDDKK